MNLGIFTCILGTPTFHVAYLNFPIDDINSQIFPRGLNESVQILTIFFILPEKSTVLARLKISKN